MHGFLSTALRKAHDGLVFSLFAVGLPCRGVGAECADLLVPDYLLTVSNGHMIVILHKIWLFRTEKREQPTYHPAAVAS